MTPRPNFVLSRATANDLEEIVDLVYDSFPKEETDLFMGCPDRTNLPKYLQRCRDIMETDKSDVWIQVRDAETGRLVACSDWRVYVNGTPDDFGDQPIEWKEGEDLEASVRQATMFNDNRRKHMKGPFVHLHICCTRTEYRRMGAGGLMMQWAVDLMDLLSIPGWIEASPNGTLLYKTFGFYVLEQVEVNGIPMANMKRNARQKGVDGTARSKARSG